MFDRRSALVRALVVFAGGCGADGEPDPRAGDECVPATLSCPEARSVVSPSWLSELSPGTVQIVDSRGRSSYEARRIPGALHVDPGALRATVNDVPGQVVTAEVAEAVLSAAGIDPTLPIVVYGDATDTTPARVVWTLQFFAHADVRLLDGGFGAWVADGGAEDTGAAQAPTPSGYTISAPIDALRVDVAWVEGHLDDSAVVLVDARSTGEYEAGHIPGARSIDWNRNVDGGSFRPLADIEALHAEIDEAATVVTYCQTGSRASVAYVVLRWLGYQDVRVYDGSWAEWGSRSDLPVDIGP